MDAIPASQQEAPSADASSEQNRPSAAPALCALTEMQRSATAHLAHVFLFTSNTDGFFSTQACRGSLMLFYKELCECNCAGWDAPMRRARPKDYDCFPTAWLSHCRSTRKKATGKHATSSSKGAMCNISSSARISSPRGLAITSRSFATAQKTRCQSRPSPSTEAAPTCSTATVSTFAPTGWYLPKTTCCQTRTSSSATAR